VEKREWNKRGRATHEGEDDHRSARFSGHRKSGMNGMTVQGYRGIRGGSRSRKVRVKKSAYNEAGMERIILGVSGLRKK
jgi:hypothetical protein